MPYGDRTGPAGEGPGTGRRLGKMSGNDMGMGSKKKKTKNKNKNKNKNPGKHISEIGY